MASVYTISREYLIETIPLLLANLNVVESIVKGSNFPTSAFTAYNTHFMKSYNVTEKLRKYSGAKQYPKDLGDKSLICGYKLIFNEYTDKVGFKKKYSDFNNLGNFRIIDRYTWFIYNNLKMSNYNLDSVIDNMYYKIVNSYYLNYLIKCKEILSSLSDTSKTKQFVWYNINPVDSLIIDPTVAALIKDIRASYIKGNDCGYLDEINVKLLKKTLGKIGNEEYLELMKKYKVSKDDKKAFDKLYERFTHFDELLEKANNGDKEACFYVGVEYAEGSVVDKNLNKAIEYFEQVNTRASVYNIGRCYFEMNQFEKAILYYEKASAAGDGKATYNLSLMYEYGNGVSKDPKKAFEILINAVDLNEKLIYRSLGRYYSKGIGTEKNLKIAKAYYKKAIELGDYLSRDKI